MKNFNEIYRQVLESSKTELEALRKKMLPRIVGCIIAAVICAILGMYLNSDAIGMIGIMICIFLAAILLMGPGSAYRKVYKEKVVKEFIKAYDPTLEFWYEKGIPRASYMEGGFERL